MNIVNKLTLRHLKENKRRSIITVCGIIVSVAMITAVTSSTMSLMGMMGEAAAANNGDWAAKYSNVSAENIDIAKQEKTFDNIIVSKDMGTSITGEEISTNGSNLLSVRSQQPDTYETVKAFLQEGNYPAKADEIIIGNNYISSNQLDWKLGDTIKLNSIVRTGGQPDIGVNTVIKEKSQFHSYDINDTFNIVSSKEYKLVGIINDSVSGTLSGYNAVAGLEMSSLGKTDFVDIFVQKSNPQLGIEDNIENLYKKMTVNENSNMRVNSKYLSYSGALLSSVAITIYSFSAVIMLLILIASVVMIYNAFAMSIGERSRYLGMLASVGATKRQKRNTVYFEGAFLGAIGIPLGVVAGLVGIGITFKLIDPLLQKTVLNSSTEIHMALRISVIGILGSVLLSMATIFVSSYIPGKIASKTTAIDAIRNTNNVKVKPKKLKTSKLTRKLFGFDGELAKKNLKRNKKKYNIIAMSLAISVALFIGVTSFTSILTSTFEISNATSKSDIVIITHDPSDVTKIKEQLAPISEISSLSTSLRSNKLLTVTSATIKNIDKLLNDGILSEYGGKKAISITLNGLEDKKFEEYCNANGTKASDYFDVSTPKMILENEIQYFYQDNEDESKAVVANPLLLKDGDKTTILDWQNESNLSKSAEITVGKVINSSSTQSSNTIKAYMPMSVLIAFEKQNAFNDVTYLFDINTDSAESVYKKLDNAQRSGLLGESHLDSPALAEQSSRALVSILSVFVYGFITLMSMVSIANIFNTISTGMNSRRREFAMLKSVGMTPKSFNKMIFMESVFYGIKALALGLTAGFMANFAMYVINGRSYEFPLSKAFNPWMYLIAILAVAGIVGTALLYSFQKIKKDNIIETIKNDDN